MTRPLIIGTRGSPLALWQARTVQAQLSALMGVADADLHFPIQILKTTGDQIKGELSQFGGKGLFTRELEVALLSRKIDLAVHSMKDVPTVGHEDLHLAAILERADPRDAFLSPKAKRLIDLPEGALIGSASIRRRAQAARLRPDLKFTLLRGNVGTRLDRLAEGYCDATFLACAGLDRLGQGVLITERVDTAAMLPAPAQGAIGIEIRKDATDTAELITHLDHAPTRRAITMERAFLEALDGSCRTPIAALLQDNRFRGEVIAKDGTLSFARSTDVSASDDVRALGLAIGAELRAEIGDQIVFDD
jgi:hydroxymethylbilane synthase